MNMDWEAHREERNKKKASNEVSSLELLRSKGIKVLVLNEKTRHYRVEGFDFWPSTGKFYDQKTGEKGRGVKELIKRVEHL